MKLAVFGGTGMVGRHIMKQALERGHELRVLVRTPEKLGEFSGKVVAVQGDYFNPEDQANTLLGTEAVLSTIGPLPGKNARPGADAFGAAMHSLVAAMQAQGIHKIRNISGAATAYSGERISFGRKLMRFMLDRMGPVVRPAKEQELAALMATDLDYVTPRPPMIKEGLEGTFIAHETDLQGMKVSAEQLAGFMLDSLEDDNWHRTQPFVGTK